MDEEKAGIAAKRETLDINTKHLKNTFMCVLVVANSVRQRKIFDEVIQEVCRLRKGKDSDAFQKAVEKNTLFRELLEFDAREDDEKEDEPAWKKNDYFF